LPFISSLQAQQPAEAARERGATALLEKHSALAKQLAENVYRRPLFLESSEGGNVVSGNAYAVLDSPFGPPSAPPSRARTGGATC
jgi:hypothetical protein